jgi:hypothetical protein
MPSILGIADGGKENVSSLELWRSIAKALELHLNQRSSEHTEPSGHF